MRFRFSGGKDAWDKAKLEAMTSWREDILRQMEANIHRDVYTKWKAVICGSPMERVEWKPVDHPPGIPQSKHKQIEQLERMWKG